VSERGPAGGRESGREGVEAREGAGRVQTGFRQEEAPEGGGDCAIGRTWATSPSSRCAGKEVRREGPRPRPPRPRLIGDSSRAADNGKSVGIRHPMGIRVKKGKKMKEQRLHRRRRRCLRQSGSEIAFDAASPRRRNREPATRQRRGSSAPRPWHVAS
jgi:hypothetical protein